jgi:hypothetical protein
MNMMWVNYNLLGVETLYGLERTSSFAICTDVCILLIILARGSSNNKEGMRHAGSVV